MLKIPGGSLKPQRSNWPQQQRPSGQPWHPPQQLRGPGIPAGRVVWPPSAPSAQPSACGKPTRWLPPVCGRGHRRGAALRCSVGRGRLPRIARHMPPSHPTPRRLPAQPRGGRRRAGPWRRRAARPRAPFFTSQHMHAREDMVFGQCETAYPRTRTSAGFGPPGPRTTEKTSTLWRGCAGDILF